MNAVYQIKQTLGKAFVVSSIVAFMWISLPASAIATTIEEPCIVCTQAALKVAEQEATQDISIENWMVNDEYWKLGTEDELIDQVETPLENWMFTMGQEVNQLPETIINLEEWMLDSFYWEIDNNLSMSQSITESLAVRDWMFEKNFWQI